MNGKYLLTAILLALLTSLAATAALAAPGGRDSARAGRSSTSP